MWTPRRTRGRLLVALLFAGLAWPAAGQPQQLSLRQIQNLSHFHGVSQLALEWRLPGRDRVQVGSRRFILDWVLAAGALHWEGGQSRFVSLGRGVRWGTAALVPRSEVQLSLSPTWIEHPVLAGRSLGGHFHFTTALAWVLPLDAEAEHLLSVRLQHTSNAGSQRENPGLDLAGLALGWRFGGLKPPRLPPRPPVTLILDFNTAKLSGRDPDPRLP